MKHFKKIRLIALTILISFNYQTFCKKIEAPISFGELVDKITILKIKSERLSDPTQLKNVLTELELLLQLFNEYIGDRLDVAEIMQELKATNEKLWEIEDILRIKERIQEFGAEFIELARKVYKTNDHRCLLKRKIDILLNSAIVEEKSHDIYS